LLHINNELIKIYIMETIKQVNKFRIDFNGGKTYFVNDDNNTCWFATGSLRKAENRLNKILTQSGLN
jgi:hypothetical protein